MTRPVKEDDQAPKKSHLGLRLNEKDHKLLAKMAKEDERTMSNLIVVLIRKEARNRGHM